jgi:hypothetical protein
MVVLGEKLGGRPTDWSAGVLRIMLGALFLRNSRVCPTVLGQHERLAHTGTARGNHTCGVRALVQEVYVSCVSCLSPAECTSIRIAMTLRYE